MKWLIVFLLLAGPARSAETDTGVFRFHLSNEPVHYSPFESSSVQSYLFNLIYDTLLKWEDSKLKPSLAKSCKEKKGTRFQVTCLLREDIVFSDGKPIKAEHFINSFKQLLDPIKKNPKAYLLFAVKNAQEFFEGKTEWKNVGITGKRNQLTFELKETDYEFIYNLALSPTTPRPVGEEKYAKENAIGFATSGPYQFEIWKPNQSIVLKPNPFYFVKNQKRPRIEILFIQEDSIALSLYETGKLDFLRRLPTVYISKYKNRDDFHKIQQLRFDYIGFADSLKNEPKMRQQMVDALDYKAWQKIYDSKKPPGCSGILDSLTNTQVCYEERPLEGVKLPKNKLKLIYSKLGGDDHKTVAEWLQNQWLKKLNLSIQLESFDNKIFLSELRNQNTDLFRKGIGPDRPSCYAALEAFTTDHPENFLHFSNLEFNTLMAKLKTTAADSEKKKLCSKALDIIMQSQILIPTGPIEFTILLNSKWTGWKLNELNHLDLNQLSLK